MPNGSGFSSYYCSYWLVAIVIDLVKKTDYNAKISNSEAKYFYYFWLNKFISEII